MNDVEKEAGKQLLTYYNLLKACKYLEQLVELEERGGTPSKQRLDEIKTFLNNVDE